MDNETKFNEIALGPSEMIEMKHLKTLPPLSRPRQWRFFIFIPRGYTTFEILRKPNVVNLKI